MSRETSRFTPTERMLVLLLAAINFNHILDFVIIMPLGDRLMNEFQIGPDYFGYMVSSYSLSAALAGFTLGGILDRYDRRHAVLFVFAGFTLSTVACGLANSYTTLLLARVMAGAFGGLSSAAIMAVIGDMFTVDKRGRATGAVMSSFAVASIIGLPVGLTLARFYGRGMPFLVLGGVSAFIWLIAFVKLPSMRRHQDRERQRYFEQLYSVVTEPEHLKAYLFMLVIVLGSFTVIPFIGPYMQANCGRKEEDLPIVYGIAGLCTLVSLNVIGKIADKFGKVRTFRVCAILAIGTILVITNLPPITTAVAALVASGFMVFTSGRMVPAQAILVGIPTPQHRGAFLGVNTAVSHIGTAIAPVIAGQILGKTASGQLTGYHIVGYVAAFFAIVALFLVKTLHPVATTATIPQTTPAIEAVPA